MIDGNFSYIQNVFPNYKATEVNTLSKTKMFAPKLPVPSTPNLDEVYNKFIKEKGSNSYFYNPPLNKIESPLLGKPLNELNTLNKISNEEAIKKQNLEDYINYVLKSDYCKEMIINTLNLESKKKRDNHIMEFIAIILIGIFLIYLLNR